MGSLHPETRQGAPKANQSYIGITLVIAAVLIVTVSGGLLWQFKRQLQQNQARSTYESAIQKLWKDDGLILDDTKKFLLDQPDLDEGQKLLKSHEAFFSSMKQVLNQPDKTASLFLPAENKEDLSNFKERLDEWTALHQNPWEKLQAEKDKATAASLYEAARNWENSRNATWKKLTSFLELQAFPLPSSALLQPLKATAKELLRRAEPTRETQTNWLDLFELLNRQNSPIDSDVQRWLKLWADLDGPTSRAAAESGLTDNTLPEWLRGKAMLVKQQLDKASAGQIADQNKKDSADHATETQKPKVVQEDAYAIPAKHDIHVCLLRPREDPIGKVAGLKVSADMQLYVGEAGDAHSIPDGKSEPKNGELRQWLSVSIEGRDEIYFGPSWLAKLDEMVRISSSGVLLALPGQYRTAANGLRLVGRSKDRVQVLFDLRLIPLSSAVVRPIFAKEVPAIADNFATATLRLPEGFIPRLHLLGLTRPVYALRLDVTASEQKIFELKHTVDSSFEVIAPSSYSALGLSIQNLRRQIAELEAGIQKDAADLANIDPRVPALVREQKKLACTMAMAEKEKQLLALRAQLQTLAAQPPVHFDLLPGRYTLLIEQPGSKIELCKLNVTSATKSSTPKPSNP